MARGKANPFKTLTVRKRRDTFRELVRARALGTPPFFSDPSDTVPS